MTDERQRPRVERSEWALIAIIGLLVWLGSPFAHADTPAEILSRIEARAEANVADVAKLREALKPVEPEPEPQPEPEPLPNPAPASFPAAGLFALQQPPQSNGSLREITEAQLRLDHIAGFIIRLHCSDVLKVDNKGAEYFDFTFTDKQAAKARRTGKKFGLLLMGDDQTKPWLDPFASKYNRVTKALGERYPDCVAWFPGGSISPPGSSEEPHWNNPMPAECVPAFSKHLDVSTVAFPKASHLWPISAKDKSGRIQQCATLLAQKAKGRAMIGHNALKLKDLPPQTPAQWLEAGHNKLAVSLAKQHGMGLQFEMVGPTLSNHPQNSSFPRCGTRDINECIGQAKRLAERAGVKWGDVHVRVYPDDVAKARK